VRQLPEKTPIASTLILDHSSKQSWITGAVDVMIDIRGNFFYTRTVPCQLWFFERAKEQDEARRDHVLMLDARNIFRKVSSPAASRARTRLLEWAHRIPAGSKTYTS
jgi:hypothetical protein